MDHQKSSPDLTTVYQIAVVVLLVSCLSVLVALFLKPEGRYGLTPIEEYSHALLIWEIEYQTLNNLSKTTTNQKQLSEAKAGLDAAILRVKNARHRLSKYDPLP